MVISSKKDIKNKKDIEIKIGKRGGRYTENTTEEGRPIGDIFKWLVKKRKKIIKKPK